MLTGNQIILENVAHQDLDKLRTWRNNPEYRKYFREYRELNADNQEKWYQSKVLNDPNTIMFSIKDKYTRELLGCCGLCYINWVHRYADLSLYIGWENSYIDNRGFAEDSCRVLFQYAFQELNLNKIWTEIYEFDEKKLALYQTLGFKIDGVLREQYFYDGKWWSSNMLSLLRSEWNPGNVNEH